MKTMKFLPMLLITLAMSICMVSCSDDDDKDPANQDYAEQGSGVYTGQLSVNNTVIQDAYVVRVSRISSTVVQVSAEFFEDGHENYNVSYENGQYILSSASSYNITIVVLGHNMTISFLNGNGSMTTFNGTKD